MRIHKIPALKLLTVFGVVVGFTCSGTAFTQDEDDSSYNQLIEEVLVSATRVERNLSDVPRSVTVVGLEELDQQLATGMEFDEILGQLVPGMGTSIQGRLNGTGQNQIRGRRLQLVVDGVVQNNGFLDFSEEFISFEPQNIERIEVIRGGTAVYGFGAAGGIISVQTKRPGSEEGIAAVTKVGTSFQEGDFSDSLAYNVFQDLAFSSDNTDYRFGASYRYRDNTFDANGNRRPSDFNLDDTKDISFFGSINHSIDDHQNLLFSFNYFQLEEHERYLSVGGNAVQNVPADTLKVPVGISNVAILPRLPIGQPIKPEGRENQMFTLSYNNDEIGSSSMNVLAYYVDRSSPSDYLLYNTGVPVAERPIGRNEGQLDRFGGRITINTPFSGSMEGSVLWGVDYEDSSYEQPNTAGIRPITPPVDQSAIAAFVQLDVQAMERLRLSGGVRYEDVSVKIPDFVVSEAFRNQAGNAVAGGTLDFSETILNLGAVYDLSDLHHLFFSFSQGFTTGEILRAVRNTTASSIATATEIRPQVIDNYEIGLRGNSADGRLAYSIAYFYSESDLGVTFVFDPVTEFSDVQRAPEELSGFEATIDFNLADNWTFGGTVSTLKGELQTSAGEWEPLPNQRIAPAKLTAYAEFSPTSRSQYRLQGLYTDSRNKFPGSSAFGEGDVNRQLLLTLSGSFDILAGNLTVAVTNLLDDQYIPPALEGLNRNDRFFAGAGRTVALTYSKNW